MHKRKSVEQERHSEAFTRMFKREQTTRTEKDTLFLDFFTGGTEPTVNVNLSDFPYAISGILLEYISESQCDC